jgi:hypothetical protein
LFFLDLLLLLTRRAYRHKNQIFPETVKHMQQGLQLVIKDILLLVKILPAIQTQNFGNGIKHPEIGRKKLIFPEAVKLVQLGLPLVIKDIL